MIIKDEKGSYELKVDAQRGIVYETINGFIDMDSYHNDYVSKVAPLLRGKKWTKCADLRNYKTSPLNDGISHFEWCSQNGMVPGAIIVESAIVKMQMNRIAKDSAMSPMVFTSLEEADEWLKSEGF